MLPGSLPAATAKELSLYSIITTHTIMQVEEWKTNLMSFAILFHFLHSQHVSDINPLVPELFF
jgi:hypothetical protein